MASKLGMMRKREVIEGRLRSATNRLHARGVDVGAFPDEGRDPEVKALARLEHTASLLEACVDRIDELKAAGEVPGGYDTLTVAMLREEAARRSLDVPARAKKAELIAALEADDAGESVEPEGGQHELEGDRSGTALPEFTDEEPFFDPAGAGDSDDEKPA